MQYRENSQTGSDFLQSFGKIILKYIYRTVSDIVKYIYFEN